MEDLKKFIPPQIYNVLERSGISTTKQIILLSKWDIQKLTNLSDTNINLIKNAACEVSSPTSLTVGKILNVNGNKTVKTGCPAIDDLLSVGFRKGTLTEIYGESGAGKTQITLQAAACNWRAGCVYICTEDLFPTKRFEQLKQVLPDCGNSSDCGDNIFIEHITEANELLACVRVRLRKLLANHKISLIIIDSVAAPFRCEYNNYILRAEDMRELAISLLKLAQDYNLACVCVNQVTANFSEIVYDKVLPSLGLAWSNMISTRLWLHKPETACAEYNQINQQNNVRELSVIFAPDLPNSSIQLVISPSGIQKFDSERC